MGGGTAAPDFNHGGRNGLAFFKAVMQRKTLQSRQIWAIKWDSSIL